MRDIGTMAAFARGRANMGQPIKVFDWNRAAELLKWQNPSYAEAGLDGDWGATGGAIWRDGKPVPREETYTYLASNWATPQLDIDGTRTDCWIYEADMPAEWGTSGSGVYWPESALAIVGASNP